MHPDAFIPFYGNEILMATQSHGNEFVGVYIRAIWYYWHHTHCKGLENDPEQLRLICCVDKLDWPKFHKLIFEANGRFFKLGEDGMWHQKRAQEIWSVARSRYDRQVKAGKVGSDKRWNKKSKHKTKI